MRIWPPKFPEVIEPQTNEEPPSEAWLFTQAILGNAIPKIVRPVRSNHLLSEQVSRDVSLSEGALDAQTCQSREALEWAAQISDDCEAKLHAIVQRERELDATWARAEQFAETLTARSFDPSKHPRGGNPENRGQFSTGWGAGGDLGTALGTQFDDLTSFGTGRDPIEFASAKTPRKEKTPPRTVHARDSRTGLYLDRTKSSNSSLKHEDVLSYFKILYGDKGQKLLRAFAKANGVLSIENPWFGDSATDSLNRWRGPQIRIGQNLDPVRAAQEFMDRLIEATGQTTVRQHLDHSGFDNVEQLIDSYRESAKQAASTAALATELYLSGISIASEGADLIVTINDVADGNYLAAIGLLPFIPAAVGKSGAVLKHGRQQLRISGEAMRGVRKLPVDELIDLLESTRKLARNMEKAGIARPAGTAAHHIVPAGIKSFDSAARARDILTKFGISVENAANGVYLPSKLEDAVKATYHGGIHSKKYCDALYARLSKAKTPEQALLVLNSIRRELLIGTFPH